jgi:hypothetical protein
MVSGWATNIQGYQTINIFSSFLLASPSIFKWRSMYVKTLHVHCRRTIYAMNKSLVFFTFHTTWNVILPLTCDTRLLFVLLFTTPPFQENLCQVGEHCFRMEIRFLIVICRFVYVRYIVNESPKIQFFLKLRKYPATIIFPVNLILGHCD